MRFRLIETKKIEPLEKATYNPNIHNEDYSPLIGKEVTIINKDSIYYHEWGIIKDFDGEFYYIAIASGTDSIPIFDRKEFRLRKDSSK